jgi:diguanylate cyclase (GGDEF)-like protein
VSGPLIRTVNRACWPSDDSRVIRLPSRARRGTRLATRLLVLVLVPLTALGISTVRTADARSHTVEQTADLQRRAVVLGAVIRLGFAMMDESAPLQTAVQAKRKGIPFAVAAVALGHEPDEWVRTARQVTDKALARASSSGDLTGLRVQLDKLRGRLDAGTADEADIETMEDLKRTVEARARGLAKDLAGRSETLSSSGAALRDVVAFQLIYEAALVQAKVSQDLFAVIGLPAGRDARADLARAQARYLAIANEIDTMGAPEIRRAWHAILNSEATRRVNDVIDGVVRSGTVASFDEQRTTLGQFTGAIQVFRLTLDRRSAHYRLVSQANDVVAADLQQMRAEADSAYREALAEALVVAVLALLGVLFLGRGITRPLRDVADRAHRIRDGDLAVDAAAGRGPREVVAVTEAFNDVAENLRLVEEQATALAAGDTEHESLKRRVPGKLGASLQASVARLSQSISARETLEGRLRHEATHDRLTGLLNRSSAIVALEQGVARAHRVGGGLAVLTVDLDGLKRVNEAAGHAGGDEVLRRAAARLARSVRGGDIVARMGADEFAVVAEVDGIEAAVELGQRIVDDLADTPAGPMGVVPASGVPMSVGASVGVALTLDGRATPASLLRDADAAVQRAKTGGGGRVEVFDEELRRKLAERTTVEAAFARAMARGELRLVYQPIVRPDGQLAGMEALCRWTDPMLGDVPPTVFVAVAEATDLVVELDRWVLGAATRQLAEWQRTGFGDVYLSVNVSGRHLLGPDFVTDVRHALTDSGVDPRALVLEITETVLLDDLLVAAQHLTQVRELGVRVAVDDFGTGYTSIAHLQRLPIDIIKVDRSFIVEMASERGLSLVRLMIDMATTLGLGLVAEGVETAVEMDQLRALGCPLIQGYFTGRPMAPDAMVTFARSAVS